jgi:hypothetical protein
VLFRKRAFAAVIAFALIIPAVGFSAETAPQTSSPQIRRSRPTLGNTGVRRKSAKPARKSPAAAPQQSPAAAAQPAVSAKPKGAVVETHLESFQRTVEIQPPAGGWKKAEKHQALIPDDKIRTGSASIARIQLADGSKVLLLQNSQAEMESLSTVEKSVRLLRGRLRAIVRKIRGGNNFKVSTPVGVASVRGTDFEVAVNDDGTDMEVRVFEGSVGVARLGDLGKEVVLNAGEKIHFGIEQELGDPIRSGAVPTQRLEIRNEIQLAQAKDAVLSMAAEESRSADYQVGKSLIDVDGRRVRVEEYITRPASNEFKLVVLNERSTRFDYFTYKGTFNTDLPDDLSVALRESQGGLSADAPDYYLTAYETVMSNTVDNITESATGGHQVQIDFDGTTYTLTDPSDPTNTRTIDAAVLQPDGTYKVYNPVQDTFALVSADSLDDATKISAFDFTTDAYRDIAASDTYWNTRFNDYSSAINGTVKTAFSKKNTVANTLAIDLDSNFSNAPLISVIEQPSGAGSLHNRLSLYYSDGSKTVYDTYIIDDEGNIAPRSAFSGLSSGTAYRNELDKWNYQQKVTSTEMGGRSIDLVVDPRIGTISGLIQ